MKYGGLIMLILLNLLLPIVMCNGFGETLQILSKSKIEKCEKSSLDDKNDNLNCTRKIIVNMAVASNFSGGEALMVAEVVEVEENSTNKMQNLRVPPMITVNKSSAYMLYELTYIRDVPYKPEEFYVKTRKCEPDADVRIVQICYKMINVTSLKPLSQSAVLVGIDNEYLRLVGASLVKGKPNTAHCLRFPGDWFHVFGIGQRTMGFSVRIEVKTGSKVSEVFVGPENTTAVSNDSFLRVNLVGDFAVYTSIPSFEDFYLAIPMQADQNRIGRHQPPLYGIVGRFERINEHPGAGPRSFSIGVTEALNTNLLLDLGADDIEYVYQRSPGKILGVTVPTFEALALFGTAKIETKNIGKVEASYSLMFQCSKGVTMMEEQFFIMKAEEVATQSFKIYPTTDQAAKYACPAILKDSDFKEVDRAECQFTTTATNLDNGTQGAPFQPPKSAKGFLGSIKDILNKFWAALSDFITGKTCRSKCTGLFDFHCHMQYVCMSWVVMFGLFLSIFPTVILLLWLLHQKGFFDPIRDECEDHFWEGQQTRENTRMLGAHTDHDRIHRRKHDPDQHQRQTANHRQRRKHSEHRHHHPHRPLDDYNEYLHHVHKDRHKHSRHGSTNVIHHLPQGHKHEDDIGHHRHRTEGNAIKRTSKLRIYDTEEAHEPYKGKNHVTDEKHGIRRRE